MEQTKVFFLLTKQELDLLEKVALFEPWLCDGIDNAKNKGGRYIVNLYAYDIDDALSALEYLVDCTESYIEKEAYIKLHDKIKENFLHSQSLRQSIAEKQICKQFGG